jgi:pyrroloquinoline quinone biosynthesis protein D
VTAPALEGSTVVRRAARMAWQTIDGETVLLDLDGQELLGLSDVGARVWALCDGTRPLEAIVDTVAVEFEVTRERAATDVQGFVGELLAMGVLERAGA